MGKEKIFELKDFLYQPIDYVLGICNPKTGVPYPINNQLKKLYEDDKNNKDISEEMLIHEDRLKVIERIYVRDHLHKTKMFENSFKLPQNHGENIKQPCNVRTEFYVFVNLNAELREKIKETNEFKFYQYLEIIGILMNFDKSKIKIKLI